ncbi:MAG: guanylate kinase [Candidatus Midichloria sp.]|nr:guanylate kinase [Candidatus Midichloria sp.]
MHGSSDNIKRRGLMLVISAPSGAGKTTLSKLLIENDQHLRASISVTTRKKRPGEVDGKDYHFVDTAKFKQMVKDNAFMEYAEIFGNFYGTLKDAVEKFLEVGEDVVFDIDWQGHRRLVATAREDVTSVFILPPSKQELYKRLKLRHHDEEGVAAFRQERANDEISHWHEYDYVIINKDLNESFNKLLSILRAERLKKNRRTGLPAFIRDLLKQEV